MGFHSLKVLGTLIILVGSAPAARAYSIPMVPIGAACDGIHDDTTAFENALTAAIATGGVLVIPLGTCIVNSSLVITGSVGIIGQGQKASILTTNSGAITQIVVNANNVILKGFQLTRTATATTGAQGISNLNSTAEPATGYSGLYIDDVRILNAHTGFNLYQGQGSITNSWADSCLGSGFKLTITANAIVPPNYYLYNDNSQFNAGFGFYIVTVAAPGLPIVYAGRHVNLYTGANTEGGYWVVGNSTTQFGKIRLSDSFFGEDGSDEVHIDAGNGSDIMDTKELINIDTEFSGYFATGPNTITPASNQGYGIYISPSTAGVDVVGGSDLIDAYSGVYLGSSYPTTVTGRREMSNGYGGTSYSGIDISATAGLVVLDGGFSGNISGGTQSYQQYGLNAVGGTVYATGLLCKFNNINKHNGAITITPTVGSC